MQEAEGGETGGIGRKKRREGEGREEKTEKERGRKRKGGSKRVLTYLSDTPSLCLHDGGGSGEAG